MSKIRRAFPLSTSLVSRINSIPRRYSSITAQTRTLATEVAGHLHNVFLHPRTPVRKLLKLILDQQVDSNAADDDGMTPILHAIRHDLTEHVCLLHKYGAKLDVTDPQGRTPLHLACMPNSEPFMEHVVKILLTHGARVNARDNWGNTPLHHVCMGSAPPCSMTVGLLLKHGADKEARNNKGVTALHLAVRWGYEPGIEVFIKRGADVNCQDSAGRTPLHYVAQSTASWAQELIDMLLDKGARLDLKDVDGYTAEEVARRNGSGLLFRRGDEDGGQR